MVRASKPGEVTSAHYSPQFKSEALALAERIGVGAAAEQLRPHSSQLYNWRSKVRL